jgi:hypothetical protein
MHQQLCEWRVCERHLLPLLEHTVRRAEDGTAMNAISERARLVVSVLVAVTWRADDVLTEAEMPAEADMHMKQLMELKQAISTANAMRALGIVMVEALAAIQAMQQALNDRDSKLKLYTREKEANQTRSAKKEGTDGFGPDRESEEEMEEEEEEEKEEDIKIDGDVERR